MNVHDSERMAGLLEAAGYAGAAAPDTADVVVFNTCAVRENADNKLYGNLGHLHPFTEHGAALFAGAMRRMSDEVDAVRARAAH